MKNLIVITVIVAIASFLAGVMVGPVFIGQKIAGQAAPATVCKNSGSFQEGWDAAKERLKESGFYGAAMPGMEIKNVNGQVQSLGEGRITVKIYPLEPLADPALDVRTVTVGADTAVFLSRQKDQAVYLKEMEVFNKAMGAAPAGTDSLPPAPPQPMTEEPADLAAVKAGDYVLVEADRDIKEAGEFAAVKIVVNRWQVPPAAPAMSTSSEPLDD